MTVASGNPGSMLMALPVLVTDRRGALMASCSDILWSMRLSVTLNTELMIDAPPGEPKAASGVPSGEKIIVGFMLLRGRLFGCTSLKPALPVNGLRLGVV